MNISEIEIGGKMRTMRASYANMRKVEVTLKERFGAILDRFLKDNYGFEDVSIIVWCGLHGDAADYMELRDIEKAIEENGLAAYLMPTLNFLLIGLNGANNSKKSEAQNETPTT